MLVHMGTFPNAYVYVSMDTGPCAHIISVFVSCPYMWFVHAFPQIVDHSHNLSAEL